MAKSSKDFVLKPGRLWPDAPSGNPMEIEVFGATGEYKSGKTLLGLSIAPGVHPECHQFVGQPRTLYLDFEKSGGSSAAARLRYGTVLWYGCMGLGNMALR